MAYCPESQTVLICINARVQTALPCELRTLAKSTKELAEKDKKPKPYRQSGKISSM